MGELADRPPGGAPPRGLLPTERTSTMELFPAWGQIDRSPRTLAHRGSWLGLVHVSESTMRRVLAEEHRVPPGNPPRDPTPRTPWPDWLERKPTRIWASEVTHVIRARRAAIAILDVVSRQGLTTLVSAQESSTQLAVAFMAALAEEDLLDRAHAHGSDAPRAALSARDPDALAELTAAGDVPPLLAISDNGPQTRSFTPREFMAALAIAQHVDRPHTPTDQTWIETLVGHVKGDWPHLEKIHDPGELERELDRAPREYNTVRPQAGIGSVTPNDEHTSGGDAIRLTRRDGLARAHDARIASRRNQPETTP